MKRAPQHILAIDCCEHCLDAFRRVPSTRFTTFQHTDQLRPGIRPQGEVALVIIGVAKYPVRRVFISQLHRFYPDVPLLILKRQEGAGKALIRGEFILSDRGREQDYEVVETFRGVMPLEPCAHSARGKHYETVGRVVRLVAEKYFDPELSLNSVAGELRVPAQSLSRILNQQVGVSFRQLLRQTRIDEAKRMLASRDYSIKEVASKVGFVDSHYFSRSFKELTGVSATEYQTQDTIV